jgi:hypothetical protein
MGLGLWLPPAGRRGVCPPAWPFFSVVKKSDLNPYAPMALCHCQKKKKKIKENKMQTVGNWKLSDLTATREFGVCR